MTDNEIKREKTFEEELPYFKERLKEVFDNYHNPNGNEDPLYICVLCDSKRIVRKAEEEINRLQEEIDNLTYTLWGVMHFVDKWLDGAELEQDEVNRAAAMREKTLRIVENTRAEAIKEFAEKLKKVWWDNDYESPDVDFDDFVDNLVKEMVGDNNESV